MISSPHEEGRARGTLRTACFFRCGCVFAVSGPRRRSGSGCGWAADSERRSERMIPGRLSGAERGQAGAERG